MPGGELRNPHRHPPGAGFPEPVPADQPALRDHVGGGAPRAATTSERFSTFLLTSPSLPRATEERGGCVIVADDYQELLSVFRSRLSRDLCEDAEDRCHETILAAWAALGGASYGEVADPRSYVGGIARRKFFDALTQAYRRQRGIAVVTAGGEGRNGSNGSNDSSPGDPLVEQARRAKLLAALFRLNERERRLIYLSYFENLPHREACARMEISSAEGSRLKYRALAKLRSQLRALRTSAR